MSAALLASRTQAMLHAPLLPTLFRLATPNVIGLFIATIAIGYDGYILGRLGADALAGVALVLPLAMLQMQMSAGGIGGAVTAAVARALGGGHREDANRLAWHALLIAAALALVFTIALLGLGPALYAAMGGKGAALDAALAYSTIIFGGAASVWFANVLGAIVRGSGNMLLPSLMISVGAISHLFLCPLLVFGWGPVPALGVTGAAISTVATNLLAAAVMAAHLLKHDGPVSLRGLNLGLRPDLLHAILRVGAPASLSPVLSNGSIAAATALIGSFGTAALAGYGVAARLEYIMVPIAFGFGTALTALVATNMGAGQHARALRATWHGGLVVTAITGSIGILVAIAPELWMDRFTSDPAVREIGATYLRIVGASYSLFGLGLALFFASQGAGRMFWPLAGSTARLAVVGIGGWFAVHVFDISAAGYFVFIAVSFAVYASMIAGAIRLGAWARH